MISFSHRIRALFFAAAMGLPFVPVVEATPAHKAALKRYYDRFLVEALNRCTTCHLPSSLKNPESLEEFPHNPFGQRLRSLGKELSASGAPSALAARIDRLADEDADGDGIANQIELLLGTNPGVPSDLPTASALETVPTIEKSFATFQESFRWKPFETVRRPDIPSMKNSGWGRNEIDSFIGEQHEARGLVPRPEAPKEVLLRRAFLDMVGLTPTPVERRQFLADNSPDAYERLIDRLLEDPRYGERWGRHWMDIWRYSDWAGWSGGNQIRDSQPHIWRWRDWIIDSLNGDKPYSQMVVEMLAADELAPEDTDSLRATGFLVRNYKMLSREQWLEDTVKHTSQAFLGVTLGCAKCHDHMTDPFPQTDYYRLRAVFEPHQVRTDRVPGELDIAKAGLVRTFDVQPAPPTYFFNRGDERKADTNRVLLPGVPGALSWNSADLNPTIIDLPRAATYPDRREFVLRETLNRSESSVEAAAKALREAIDPTSDKRRELELALATAEARHEGLVSLLRLEDIQEKLGKDHAETRDLASVVAGLQKKAALLDAKLKLLQTVMGEREALAAQKDVEKAAKMRAEAEKMVAKAESDFGKGWGVEYQPREAKSFPATSSGRRLAFARWVADDRNPLTARVAVNHIWLRHFGRGIVTTPENFGANGNPPSQPELLDWLASEFVSRGWKMKALHRLILTSSTYRMASTGHEANSARDPDNIYLWRMPSRRLDAELVRDNLLACAGDLDGTMGGPEIDHMAGLASKRRSVYLEIAAEKEVEFLKIFDGPAVTECYQRHTTVMPQQALALANSKIAMDQARALSSRLGDLKNSHFITQAFVKILARDPRPEELEACAEFMSKSSDSRKARENLVLVLFNHNDFVTVR